MAPSLTPHANYAAALRRCLHIRADHPQRPERRAAMEAAAGELVAYEREHLSVANFARREASARRTAGRHARLMLRDAMYDQKRRAREARQ